MRHTNCAHICVSCQVQRTETLEGDVGFEYKDLEKLKDGNFEKNDLTSKIIWKMGTSKKICHIRQKIRHIRFPAVTVTLH